ncbi:oxalate decarboxylase [Moniliophthora roreri MCA 2997]|uniref:Oxalate decarboxylase n=1 Tax=Moniliophthora roreri (strain MCA 2997) TaxID=1381753 RepID=V2Y750_MONRO|nr:oxalate decarboxylase [Moniliophthora roreri MCA 2997]
MIHIRAVALLALLCLCRLAVVAAPTSSNSTSVAPSLASSSSSAPEPSATVPFASTDPNLPLWGPDSDPSVPAPVRGPLGAPILGPDNPPLELQNPDLLAPPTTDNGQIGNAKWPFSLSSNRIQTGGWARQQNAQLMPIAQNMAGVNMRLEAGAIRELHWHRTPEWAYVLKGTTQITAVDQNGKNFVANVGPGDLWYFPAGIPHSLQATGDNPEGSEFLLIFPDGNFDENETFLLTDWLAHVPFEVIQKNFGVSDAEAFSRIPARQLYIFPATPPTTDQAPSDPQGTVPEPFAFSLFQVPATPLAGGTVKIVDSTTFKVSTTIALAEVTVEPGALRELHWHPTADEWTFFLEGEGRVTIFASQSNARTFNYQGGDIAYVPASMGHYVENTGNTTLKFLEIFNTDRFADVSLTQWLALTPPAVVQAHLGLDNETIANLNKTKATVVAPLKNGNSSDSENYRAIFDKCMGCEGN